MDQTLVTKLANLNKEFYSKTSSDFDDSRSYAWKGWDRLLEIINLNLKSNSKLRCLDVGCGNARFATFLKNNFEDVEYTGIDFSSELIEFAKKRLDDLQIESELINKDLVGEEWINDVDSDFDLVVSFGVLHHIPGIENRKRFVSDLLRRVSDKGIVVVAAWQFDKLESLMARKDTNVDVGFDLDGLEDNDYILDWKRGTQAYRYSHLTTEEEFKNLIPNDAKLIKSFEADGKSGNINKYFIISK